MAAATTASARIPPYDKMLWPTLQAIKQLGNSGSNQEIEDRAIEIAGYSEEQLSVLHGDGPQTEIRYRMAWARTYLKAVGAIENSSRGVWAITDYGQSLTEADMEGIPARVRARFPRKTPSKEPAASRILETPTPVAEEPRVFTSTVFEEWRDHLLGVVQSMPPGMPSAKPPDVLDLIDGDALSTILKNLNLGVSTRQVEEVIVDEDWFDSV